LESQEHARILHEVRRLLSHLPCDEKNIVLDRLREIDSIPLSAFKNQLPGLEAIVKYLREESGKSVAEIASILKRRPSTIYATYRQARKRMVGRLVVSGRDIIPLSIFQDRSYSILESLVHFLHCNEGLSMKKLTEKLRTGYSTNRTVYRRYMLKAKKQFRNEKSGLPKKED